MSSPKQASKKTDEQLVATTVEAPTLLERNGPPHQRSNGAAVGGPANQVPGVGQGAGGPGDGQGPGKGAGQGLPQKTQPQTNDQTSENAAPDGPTTSGDRNGPPHQRSNGAAIGGPANQVPGVGQGAGGPGDGQGPGNGAGQGLPQKPQKPDAESSYPEEPVNEQQPETPTEETQEPSDSNTPSIEPEDRPEKGEQSSEPTAEVNTEATLEPAASSDHQTQPSEQATDQQELQQEAPTSLEPIALAVISDTSPIQPSAQPEAEATDLTNSKTPEALEAASKPAAEEETVTAPTENPTSTCSEPTATTENSADNSQLHQQPLEQEPAPQQDMPVDPEPMAIEATKTVIPAEDTTPAAAEAPLQANSDPTEALPDETPLFEADGLLNLNDIDGEGTTLRIELTSDCAFINRVAFVKVDYDPLSGTSINGQEAENSDSFRSLVQDNLINPNGEVLNIGGRTSRTLLWDISSEDAGFYVPVLMSQPGELITLGSAADNRDHVLLKGDTLCFEDLMSYQNSDWDYNDLTVRMTEI